jgi:hypothetical protein
MSGGPALLLSAGEDVAMGRSSRGALLAVLLLSSMAPWPAVGQNQPPAARFPKAGTIEIAAGLGTYVGLLRYAGQPPYDITFCVPEDCPPRGPERRRQRTVHLGGTLGVWLSQRSAIDGSFWYSPSGRTFGDRSNLLCSLRYILNLTPRRATYSYLVAGPSIVTRHSAEMTVTRPAAELGVGVRFASRLRGELNDYWYKTDKQQHDLLLSIGMSFLVAEPE